MDILIALPLNIILIPVYAVLALMVYFDIGKPVIFRQQRSCLYVKPFDLIKFRSMTNETDGNGHLLPEAERTTKLGKFIRKYSLDELVSIWLIVLPLSFVMAFVVKASPVVVVCCLNADQIFKCVPAFLMSHYGNWIRKLTRD